MSLKAKLIRRGNYDTMYGTTYVYTFEDAQGHQLVWKTGTWLEQEKFKVVGLQRKLMQVTAESYVNRGDVLHFEEGLEPALVRELADAIVSKCSGRAAVFSGSDESGYSYCLAAREGDLRPFGKELNAALNGRGGGKPGFLQGSVKATKEEIKTFFETKLQEEII